MPDTGEKSLQTNTSLSVQCLAINCEWCRRKLKLELETQTVHFSTFIFSVSIRKIRNRSFSKGSENSDEDYADFEEIVIQWKIKKVKSNNHIYYRRIWGGHDRNFKYLQENNAYLLISSWYYLCYWLCLYLLMYEMFYVLCHLLYMYFVYDFYNK